jgi:hypothetical protein
MKDVLIGIGIVLFFILMSVLTVVITNKIMNDNMMTINSKIANYEDNFNQLKDKSIVKFEEYDKSIDIILNDIKNLKSNVHVNYDKKFKEYDLILEQFKTFNQRFEDLSGDINQKLFDFTITIDNNYNGNVSAINAVKDELDSKIFDLKNEIDSLKQSKQDMLEPNEEKTKKPLTDYFKLNGEE